MNEWAAWICTQLTRAAFCSKLTDRDFVHLIDAEQKNYTDRKNCIEMLCDDCSKGELISKCLFGVFNSAKKRTKTIRYKVS